MQLGLVDDILDLCTQMKGAVSGRGTYDASEEHGQTALVACVPFRTVLLMLQSRLRQIFSVRLVIGFCVRCGFELFADRSTDAVEVKVKLHVSR